MVSQMLADPSIFDFLVERTKAGEETALVTVTDVKGASVRNPGAHMAVTLGGESVGSLSGGCIESAVVAEAQLAMKDGQSLKLRYGAGSPIIDIRLPCGGSVDLLICPVAGSNWPYLAQQSLSHRRPVHITLKSGQTGAEVTPGEARFSAGWDDECFVINHLPRMRINIVGHGGSVLALANLARAIQAEILVLSPDLAIVRDAAGEGFEAVHLNSPTDVAVFRSDAWTANIFYFHDHDWEPPLIAAALAGQGFFVGAMGSRKTQDVRCNMLLEYGVAVESIARLSAPVGLFHSSRDPATLALSTLAQIVQVYHERCVE